MRHLARNSLITVAAAGGLLAAGGGYAHADSGAQGTAANSPGVLSGNTVQVPVDAPVNACGNTVNVVGALNPAMGNDCSNGSGGGSSESSGDHGSNQQGGSDAQAQGSSSNSPGVGSGNVVQVPVNAPVNVCGNSVNVVGAGNTAAGNDCSNESGHDHEKPDHPDHPDEPKNPEKPHNPDKPDSPEKPEDKPKPADKAPSSDKDTQLVAQPEATEQLAETGSDSLPLTLPISAGLLIGGALLYRRSRVKA
ncbi:MAG TPA: hypothetical protein DEQ61_20610 [Streptomyces sp.]|nr:hypothetical protein [Streptomyces sp.]